MSPASHITARSYGTPDGCIKQISSRFRQIYDFTIIHVVRCEASCFVAHFSPARVNGAHGGEDKRVSSATRHSRHRNAPRKSSPCKVDLLQTSHVMSDTKSDRLQERNA